ncbi:hypothetical protein EDB80DRAFT_730018 [Neofusicoccum parvum]|nr:hypothetical protein EDB80DRAFT_730018 [Neofusicoccum parvum]
MLECLIAWNLEKNNGLKPGLMIDVLALDKAPLSLTAETIRRRVSSKLFHQRILDAVLHDQHLQAAEEDQGDVGRLSEIEFQRRNILFCSYRVATLWRHLYSSKLVYLVYFWAVYRFFTFLAFPTEENMRRCPTWLRPTNIQWLNYHPVWIDFIFWPRLRDRLSTTWPSYESNALLFHCVRTLEIDGFQDKDAEAMLFLQPDGSGIEVNDAFEPIFHSLQHFRAREEFAFFYPGLAPPGPGDGG